MTDPDALLLEATAACNQGHWRRAFELANPLLAIAPEHAGVHHLVGLAVPGMQQMPRAIRHLQRALKLEPRSDHATHFAKAFSLASQMAVAQVRQPMNRGSIGRWRRYAEQTADLRKLLLESGIVVRD